MKKFFILILFSITMWSFHVGAQKWVSTSPQNKNVVLEEFTGIHCGYCPDGHKRANDLYTSNPGRIVLINIHAGSFATPSGSEPDFRTTEGDALNTLGGISSYPSGSINRANSPWGKTRDLWSGLASTIMSQSSPVNVAVRSSVDLTTRVLTVEVEVYYTANSPQSANYLTVDLLQDNYLGYQSDYGNYNPTKWMGPNYRHMHALRMVLSSSGATGEKLDTTTSGKYYYKKYQVTLPASIKNVTLYAHLLKIAAFVAESQANIYTGVETDVEIDPLMKTDLSLTNNTTPITSLCLSSINPKIEVTNLMDQVVTSFTATAYISGTAYTKNFSGSLAKNDKITLDFGNINMTSGGNFTFSTYGFTNINNGNLLERNWDDNASSSSGLGFITNAFTTATGGFNGSMPANFGFDYTNNSAFKIFNNTSPTYGAKGTTGAVLFYLASGNNVAGKPGHIICGQADFTSMTNPYLTFYYAYSDGTFGGTAPVIKVSVSKDCGATWDEIRSITATETGTSNQLTIYVPKSSEYIWVGTPLTSYAGKSVLVRITGIPGTNGNALFIDEIQIAQASGISDKLFNASVTVYPNPVQGLGHFDFNLTKSSKVSFSIYNSLGATVYSSELTEYPEGNNSVSFDASQFATGSYILRLNNGTETISKVFIK